MKRFFRYLKKPVLRLKRIFFLAYSPEREDPGNTKFSTSTIPKIIGGIGPKSLKLAKELYDQIICQTVALNSTKEAEACKILENIYRCVNISLVNELKVLFAHMGIDIWNVIEAAKIKAEHPLSFADCFAAATAKKNNSVIMTGDPEFKKIEDFVAIEWLDT